MKQLAEAGVVTLGWGSADQQSPHSAPYEWFALWQAPSKELANGFLEGVERSGWNTCFEQSNVVGELRPFETVAAEHLALEAEAR
jgi:hypothetical protein